MGEYKLVIGSPIECQKWLNQWKHEFELEILGFQHYKEGTQDKVAILLLRTKK